MCFCTGTPTRTIKEDERGKTCSNGPSCQSCHQCHQCHVSSDSLEEVEEENVISVTQTIQRWQLWQGWMMNGDMLSHWRRQLYHNPLKRQPVVTRFSAFKGRRKVGRRRSSVGVGAHLPTNPLLSLHCILVLFLLILHHLPFTTQKGSSPSGLQQSFSSSSSSSSSPSSPPRLIFANRRDIRIIDFYFRGGGSNIRGNTSVVVSELADATALDIHYKAGVVCWLDIQRQKIECSSFNSTATEQANPPLPFTNKKTTIVSAGVVAPEDIVCDYITGNLYWTDSETNRLEVVSIFPPFHRKVLIWDDIDQPRALAVAPNLGYLFWSDWGEHPKIERCSMDGSLRKVIVDENVFWPNGIALDLFQQHVYWADAKLHYIGRVDFEGGGREIINKAAPQHPFALVYTSGFLYWSDWRTNSLHVMRSDGTNWKTLTHKQPLTPMDLAVFSEQLYPPPVWTDRYPVSPCASAGCSHLCLLHSVQPYFKCACPIGIKLLPNSTTRCSPEINNFLIVARGADIRRISLDTEDFTDVTIPLSGIKHVLAVDYHVESGYVYWTDDEATRIKRAKLDGSNQQIVVKHEIIHPDGLVVDWVAQNLYWTDAGTDRIEVSRLDGTFRRILISRGLQEPRAISVDPGKGLLFWSDWGKKAKIETSLLDGSERHAVVNEEIYWPNGISLDLRAEKIYWSDAKADRIEVCGYDGSGRRTVLQEDLPHIFGIALLGDYIYWTDWQRRSLERADKNTGLNRMTIKEPFTDPMGIKGINVGDTQMWNLSNPCKGNNGGCEHLCIYKPNVPPNNYICACSSGYELSTDERSCTIPDAFIVFSRDGDLHRISLNRTASTNMDDVIPVSKVKAASALDFDTVDSRIYWSDTKIKAIFRAFMNGSDTEKIIEFGVATPEGIAVDWLSRNIYWTDLDRNRIEVAKLNGDHRRTVLWLEIESPKSITLHPSKGWMYYALWNTRHPSIERAALDGTKRTTFVNGVGRANGLTIDLEENYLYWTDIDALIIERCSLDEPQRTRHIVQGARNGFKPFSLAQYEEYIYWSDMTSQTIQRAHKSVSVFHGGSGQERPLRLATAQNVIDMAIYHKLKQVGWNPCSVSNCSHLCFSIPGGSQKVGTMAQCGCPTHYILSPDGSYCVPPKSYLLYSSGATVSRLILDTKDCPDAVVMGGQSQRQRGISAVTWDGHSRSIYWIDAKTQDIKKAAENGAGATILLNYVDETFKAYDLVFDPVRQLLFWTCENYNSINVTDPSGKNLGSVLSSASVVGGTQTNEGDDEAEIRPRLLALHPYNSHLYFSNDGKIERIKVDGMQRVVVVHGVHSVGGIAVDVAEGLLYWSDSGSRKLEMSDLDGGNRKLLIGGLDSPTSIAVMGRFVYWIEERGGVERVDKYIGEERYRALPRNEIANHIVFINDTISEHPFSNCDNRCHQLCVDSECSCFEGFVLSKEDHRTCGYRLPCGPHEFSCSRGKVGCISLQFKCNGMAECADGSDELDCAEELCDFRCPCQQGTCFKPVCLKKHQVCDGKPDCPGGGYDESQLACNKDGTTIPPEASTHHSPMTTVVMPILIIAGVIVGAVSWYFIKIRNNQFSSEGDACTDPLNAGGTNMTTVNTADTLHQFASTNGSSSMGSSPYCEPLVPHPSPATEVRSFCCHGHGNYAMYYKSVEPGPPPTPCSTDVCDNSDIYAFAPPPSPHTSSPHSTIRSYPPYYPPPPSPDLT